MNNINTLKYPIILVHGIFARDNSNVFDFWGRIPKLLEDLGANVYFGMTDAWGSIETNSELLKQTIDIALEKTTTKKVHIIAHSKGGLDARYCIWKYNLNEKIASLITICTPHHGSEIADEILKQKYFHTYIAKKAMNIFCSIFFDKYPNPYRLVHDLTTEYLKDFNNRTIWDENIYFHSYYTNMNTIFDDMTFAFSYIYLKFKVGNNDGVISEKSCLWGKRQTKINIFKKGISHAAILDIKKKNIGEINILDIYKSIINEIREVEIAEQSLQLDSAP